MPGVNDPAVDFPTDDFAAVRILDQFAEISLPVGSFSPETTLLQQQHGSFDNGNAYPAAEAFEADKIKMPHPGFTTGDRIISAEMDSPGYKPWVLFQCHRMTIKSVIIIPHGYPASGSASDDPVSDINTVSA